jgi:hypothetical protein
MVAFPQTAPQPLELPLALEIRHDHHTAPCEITLVVTHWYVPIESQAERQP